MYCTALTEIHVDRSQNQGPLVGRFYTWRSAVLSEYMFCNSGEGPFVFKVLATTSSTAIHLSRHDWIASMFQNQRVLVFVLTPLADICPADELTSQGKG